MQEEAGQQALQRLDAEVDVWLQRLKRYGWSWHKPKNNCGNVVRKTWQRGVLW